ncbi:MAG: hypothetical protein SOZ59_15730 [Candidatus Limivivens sp.]|nr:hypothetical protein [Candidatus Limivivens sp.]
MLKQYLKFIFVLCCVLAAWIRFSRRQGSFWIPAALTLALAADYCFLFSKNYLMAVGFFCGVQSCYCLVQKPSLPIIRRKAPAGAGILRLLFFWLKGLAGTGILWLFFSLAGVALDPQSLIAFFYFVCLLCNLFTAGKSGNYWLLSCLILLFIGDIHVGVYNLHHYLPVARYTWYQIWWELSTPLIWGFYLPGQLLQTVKMPEISHPRQKHP